MVNERVAITALSDLSIFDNARAAGQALKKSIDSWFVIGRAVVRAREIADAYTGKVGSGRIFRSIIEEQNLGDIVSKATASHLLEIMARQAEVTKWHNELPGNLQWQYAAPTTILKHCPIFRKQPKADNNKEPKFKPAALDHAMDSMRFHLDRMDEDGKRAVIEKIAGPQREEGDLFKATDTAKDIATVLVGMFKPRKAEEIARSMLRMLKERELAAV
jgi:hypothetical protein